jgi:hypothetical protein
MGLRDFNHIQQQDDRLPFHLNMGRYGNEGFVIRRRPCVGRKADLAIVFLVRLVSMLFSLARLITNL